MCARYTATTPIEELVRQFQVDDVAIAPDEVPPPRWNVAPTLPVVAVAQSRDGTTRRLGLLRWGLVPSWAKDPKIGSRLINARAETVATAPAFRAAFERRRCLIPASGYYEWDAVEVPGRAKPAKQPYWIHPADDSSLALAGLWEVWYDAEGHRWRTCTIITTEANHATRDLHDRMPVVLPAASWDRWLAPEPLTAEEVTTMLAPAPEDLLDVRKIAALVNKATNEGPALIEPAPDRPLPTPQALDLGQ
jgi:putative SOS response-associated peptidase YedK